MEIEKLNSLRTRHSLVHLERYGIENVADVKGFLIDAGAEWILLNEVTDFHTNGYCLVRREYVDNVKRGRYERSLEAILRCEGMRADSKIGFSLPLDDTAEMFAALHAAETPVIVEGEAEDQESFHIGRLVRAGNHSLSILHFDATGRLDEIPSLVPFEGITRVTFASEYLNVFMKYAR